MVRRNICKRAKMGIWMSVGGCGFTKEEERHPGKGHKGKEMDGG
jgi:hypothetical protein